MFSFLRLSFKSSKSQTITKGAILIALFSILSKLLGMLRYSLLAAKFGASGPVADSFMAAFRIPDFIFNILAVGAFSTAFVPVFLNLYNARVGGDLTREKPQDLGVEPSQIGLGSVNIEAAQLASAVTEKRTVFAGTRKWFYEMQKKMLSGIKGTVLEQSTNQEPYWVLTNTLLNLFLFSLLFITAIIYIFIPQIIPLLVSGFDETRLTLTIKFTRIMLLSPIIFGVSNIMSSVLQAVRRFTFFALAPVVYSLGIILGIVLLYPIIGPVGLAWGVVLGACLHLLVQFPAVFHLGFRWNGIFTWQNKEVKQVLKLMIPRVLALSANQVNQLVNTFLTSHLAAGSVFIFYSAYDLASVPVSLVAVSLAVSSFPVLAEKFVKKDIDTFRQVLLKIIRHILILVIPISIFMILLRAQIIRLTLGYGRYNWNDTIRTFEVLAVFSLSLFAQSLVPPLARAFYARQNTKTPLLISIVSILINIILGFVLVQSYGLLGLTAAFSIASIINCLVLWLVLQFEVKGLIDIKIIKDLSQYVLAAVVAGLTLYSSLRLSAFLFGTQRVWSLLVQTVLSFLVGSGAYLLVLWGLGDIEIKKLKIRYLR